MRWMEGSNPTPIGSWLRCYRCWSQELEVQVHYEGIHRIDPVSGERAEVVDEIQESLAALRAQGGQLVGELVNYEDAYWLCYVRGPAGIIVELAEKIG